MLSPHLRRTWRLLLLYALLIFPLSFVLPYWTNVENGPIENTQVLTLLGGCALCLRYGRSASLSLSRMWQSAAGVFLILALRELSWGRVFFPLGHTETGEPILMASADMPFHTEIHIAVGLAAALCLYGLARYTPWRQVFHGIALPWRHFVLLVLCMAFVTLGDHHALFHTLQDQTIEELSELLLYLTLCHTAWYYRLHFEK